MFNYVTGLFLVWFITYICSPIIINNERDQITWNKINKILLIIIFVSAPIAMIYDGVTDCNNDSLNIRNCNNASPYEDGYRGYGLARSE